MGKGKSLQPNLGRAYISDVNEVLNIFVGAHLSRHDVVALMHVFIQVHDTLGRRTRFSVNERVILEQQIQTVRHYRLVIENSAPHQHRTSIALKSVHEITPTTLELRLCTVRLGEIV